MRRSTVDTMSTPSLNLLDVDLADARNHDSPRVGGVDRSVLPIEDRHVANSHVGLLWT